MQGDKTGYAHSDEIDLKQLEASAKAARVIAEGSGDAPSVSLTPARSHNLYAVAKPAIETPIVDKGLDAQTIKKLCRCYVHT